MPEHLSLVEAFAAREFRFSLGKSLLNLRHVIGWKTTCDGFKHLFRCHLPLACHAE